ncbi:hypothetical protein B6N31_19405 [Dickeya fangzhongdai]|uniref:hypothetical protein n=1 Tax=Dickeya fangzhongdai TaxID=1778540 RepID=UPI000EAEA496|nr:hypothetical protein [Dickeya fangzhongdai]AYH49658.1 hypothetical protein B6N31_19405 [Dickeya fangzhongdai]
MAGHRLLSSLDVKDRVPGVTSALIGVSGCFCLRNIEKNQPAVDGGLTKGRRLRPESINAARR